MCQNEFKGGLWLARFSKNNFKMIIREIEAMEAADQNIWVPIGILEYMFDDYIGYIDNYFHRDKSKRYNWIMVIFKCL